MDFLVANIKYLLWINKKIFHSARLKVKFPILKVVAMIFQVWLLRYAIIKQPKALFKQVLVETKPNKSNFNSGLVQYVR